MKFLGTAGKWRVERDGDEHHVYLQEYREAFQALYVNQKVILDENGEYTVQRFRHRNIDINLVLHLYSLDDITDEDAAIVVEILKKKGVRCSAMIMPKEYVKSSTNSVTFEISELVDFLRSRSYLVPFKGYSVEQIISMGWAKIRKR